MVEGLVIDQGDHGTANVPKWQPSQPRKSFWTGLKQSKAEQLEVMTLRCGRCGYLESYATAG